ncbi:hypothetical protein PENTCL1PPCAC_18227 [Pristionchus entomophagus]|uniref:Uncharacterized protein n=1 Tax=Pristionchus entomophagus TaxID=358040 RepID=A0AAV5TP81_9BILA|nr:hypothetical protein PENTCL1PPCAC_18227 [Pristionchus entomophagus]
MSAPPHFPSQAYKSAPHPYQDYQGNNGYYLSHPSHPYHPSHPSHQPPHYPNMNNSYFPPSHPQGPMDNGQGWHHGYAPPPHNRQYNYPTIGWNSPSLDHVPDCGADASWRGKMDHSHPQYNHQIRSSLLDDKNNHPHHSEGKEEGEKGDKRWGEGGRPPPLAIPSIPSRHRYNSLRSGTSSSSSSEPEIRGGLSSRELREYATLIQDLWKDQRFAQEFKKYDIREYIKIKDLLEQVKEKRRE